MFRYYVDDIQVCVCTAVSVVSKEYIAQPTQGTCTVQYGTLLTTVWLQTVTADSPVCLMSWM